MITIILEPAGKERELEGCKSVRAVLNRLKLRQNEALTILETADGLRLVTWDTMLREGDRLRIRPVVSSG